jgi:ribosomal protein S5
MASVEPDFDAHLGPAQAGTNVLAGDLVDPVVELDGVAIAHLSGFDIAQ